KTLAIDKAPEAGLLLQHSTLVPGLSLAPDGRPQSPDSLSIEGPAGPGRFDLLLYRSIAGPLRLPGNDGFLFLEDSIVDGGSGSQPALSASRLALARSTVLGEADIEVVDLASDALFTGSATAQRAQEG